MKGICLLHLKRPEEALEAFGKCLEKSPGLEAALLGKGVALQLAWEFDEAVEVYEQVLRRNPNCDEARSNLIALGMQRKDYALVRQHAQALLDRDGPSQAALEGLSTAAFAEGNFEECGQALLPAGGTESAQLRLLVQPGRDVSKNGQAAGFRGGLSERGLAASGRHRRAHQPGGRAPRDGRSGRLAAGAGGGAGDRAGADRSALPARGRDRGAGLDRASREAVRRTGRKGLPGIRERTVPVRISAAAARGLPGRGGLPGGLPAEASGLDRRGAEPGAGVLEAGQALANRRTFWWSC